jgi:hypothetical protein
MANYTVELRHVVEAPTNIFNFQYDFFTDDLTGLPAEIYTITKNKLTKEKFQQHFIDHFYFYEIGQETVGKFIHYLKVTFHEKLPYYNMLFTSALMDYAILYNYNLTKHQHAQQRTI